MTATQTALLELADSNRSRRKSLKEGLARFMDPRAFTDTVPLRVTRTCSQAGKVQHDKLKARRDISLERADAAIRFFLKPHNLAALNARAAQLNGGGE